MPTREELIASAYDVEEIREYIGADSLDYLSREGMLASVSGPAESYCTACWTGEYRIPISLEDRGQQDLFPIRTAEE